MKRLLLALCFTPLLSQAQQSIGYVDIQEIFYAMPERIEAERELEAFVHSMTDELEAMEFNYEQKIKEYEQLDPKAPASVRESLQIRIAQIEEQINSLSHASSELIGKRENELMKPIHDKILLTVTLVADEIGYTHVFDVATALVFPPENEFTKTVLSKLGR